MRNLPSLVVSAVSTWDGKALAKGEKQIGGFEKGIKGLGKAIGAAFSVTAILAFGKASVKAFAEDEKAAVRLTRTVNNLGLGFENTRITKFIADLEKTANVSDDVLRPAFSALLTTTGSVEKSQKMLALALDVAAGSGEDVTTVANDLAAAYVGNTKGLSKYRLGLTKAELAGKGFNEIQELLNAQFSGQNAARLDTYEGKMAALTVSFGNMQEIIGKGLVEAFALLAGDGGIESATSAMEKFGQTASDALVGAASYLDKLLSKFDGLRGMSGGFDWLQLVPIVGSWPGIVEDLATEGRKVTGRDKQYGGRYADIYNAQKEAANAKARAKAEADAAKRQKELLALQKKSAIAEKNKLSLSKAAAVFDSTRISIAAALRATYDKETILRLEALQAIEEDNGELALKKIGEIAAFQKNADLAKLAGIKEVSDATLNELNTRLLAELKVINDSKMAEGDKELAREEAFKKYNAAIVAAGTLAAKEQYSERTQIQLTEIARLASLSNTTSAIKTQALLREQVELSMIDRIAKAQAAADAARLKALQEYLNLLGKAGTGTTATSGTTAEYTIPKNTTDFTANNPIIAKLVEDVNFASANVTDQFFKALVDGADISSAVRGANYQARAEAEYLASLQKISLTNAVAQGSLTQGLDAGLSLAAAASGSRYAAQAAATYNLNFNTGAIAAPDEFVVLIQDTIQKINRGGDPLTTAGSL
jgi:hypothetical protein